MRKKGFLSITIDKEIIELLKKKSKELDRSVSYIINEILKKDLENEK